MGKKKKLLIQMAIVAVLLIAYGLIFGVDTGVGAGLEVLKLYRFL